MTLSVSYARELKPDLPTRAFMPARSRLFWLPVHLSVIALSMYAIGSGVVPWLLVPALSLCIGMSFAGLTFLAHESLHGAVVRNRRVRHAVGWIGFSHFVISPRLWNAWHNRVHHGHTNHPELDPDAYPTLHAYEGSRWVRTALKLAPGNGRWSGLFALFFGFSIHSGHMLLVAGRRAYLTRAEHRLAIAETVLGAAVWTAVAISLGFWSFVFAYMLPLILANAIVMCFILTNHSLSPMADHNDTLLSTLSVTLPPVLEWVTLRFGYHVEHHLFPSMSSRHATAVRELLRKRWPERYQTLPLGQALLLLHRTPRVYKDPYTVIDPGTRRECRTLVPSMLTPEA